MNVFITHNESELCTIKKFAADFFKVQFQTRVDCHLASISLNIVVRRMMALRCEEKTKINRFVYGSKFDMNHTHLYTVYTICIYNICHCIHGTNSI